MSDTKIRIAIDAMGGDFAPLEVVKGSFLAAFESDIEIILVGKEDELKGELDKYDPNPALTILDAPSAVEMGESPASAVKAKPNSSVSLAAKLVLDGGADAFISFGNTGAAMSAAFLHIGRISGVLRPAIAVTLPTARGASVLLDAGANTDCKPDVLKQFAVMGSAYAKAMLGLKSPTVGLLNVGEEASKGSERLKEAHALMSGVEGFYGNIEGDDIAKGTVDVIVCDGQTGNIVLKLAEGLSSEIFSRIRIAMSSSLTTRLAGLLLKKSFQDLKRELDYEEYGGAILLGINGVAIVGHGKSKAKAVKNGILVAAKIASKNMLADIEQHL